MTAIPKLAENVFAFIDRAADMRGAMMAERFSQEMYGNCIDMKMHSPIEQLFWVAAQLLCEANYVAVNPECEYSKDGNHKYECGAYIHQQFPIGNYKVDFMLEQHGIGPDDILKPVVVELDGHAFHDKDKRQRSYEKARDRFLVKAGYRVLHFTGSDVVADPFKVAFEALEMIGVFAGSGIEAYNPKDPLGQGY
jgi:very-short-patch-repair endonuclease